MDDLLNEFLTESAESLAVLDVELVKFEQNPQDTAILQNIFRLVHTIKGTCGFLDLPRLEAVAHAGENVLGKFREGALEVTPGAEEDAATEEAPADMPPVAEGGFPIAQELHDEVAEATAQGKKAATDEEIAAEIKAKGAKAQGPAGGAAPPSRALRRAPFGWTRWCRLCLT